MRIGLTRVWELWAATAPRFVGAPAQAAALHHALQALAADHRVELPVNSWDTSTRPWLPTWVKVPANRSRGRSEGWRRYPWCTHLGWVGSLPTLSNRQYRDLVAVHDWLVSNREAPLAPVRYRSAELFGDEKHLDNLARTQLFRPGRLSCELLRCRRLPPPLPAQPVGSDPDILVVENSDPYWAAADVLGALSRHPIRAVAWGSGAAFPAQVEALTVDVAGGGPVTGTAWYWGDFDPRGARIGADAASASAGKAGCDGVTILPAGELWRAMADRPLQKAGTVEWPAETPGATWLGPELWEHLAPIREAEARIAQEAVPMEAIAAWARTLRPA